MGQGRPVPWIAGLVSPAAGTAGLAAPGLRRDATDIIEHPELVAQRLPRFARLAGPENLIAGTDCGLGNGVGHPEIAWAKLEDLSEGARIASRALFRDSR